MLWDAAFVIALAVVMAAPLPLGSNRPLFWGGNAMAAALALIVLGLAQLRATTPLPSLSPPLRLAGLCFAGVVAWMAIQALPGMPSGLSHPLWQATGEILRQPLAQSISIWSKGTGYAVIRWLSAAALFVVFLQTTGERWRADAALLAITAAAALYALSGIVLHLNAPMLPIGVEKWAYFDFVTGPFVNPNSFATFLGVAMMAILAAALFRVDRFQAGATVRYRGGWVLLSAILQPATLMLLVMGTLVVLALLSTGSRAGIAATVTGAVVLLIVFAIRSKHRSGVATVLAAILLVALMLGLVIFVGDAMTGGEREAASDVQNRYRLSRDTIAAILARPWTGHGAGAFTDIFATYIGGDIHVGRSFREAHNTYLELTAEIGVPAALIAGAMFALLAFPVVLAAFSRRVGHPAPLAATGALVVVAVHAFFDFSIQIQAVAFLFFALLAIGHAQSGRQSERQSRSTAPRPGASSE